MILVALAEAADRGELLLVEGGMCRFHLRRDGVVVIRELLVLPDCRHEGIGKRLVQEIALRHQGCPLLARCPVTYPSNAFWEAIGFERGPQRRGVNEWWLRSSSTARKNQERI